jgi:hypothetical protein
MPVAPVKRRDDIPANLARAARDGPNTQPRGYDKQRRKINHSQYEKWIVRVFVKLATSSSALLRLSQCKAPTVYSRFKQRDTTSCDPIASTQQILHEMPLVPSNLELAMKLSGSEVNYSD